MRTDAVAAVPLRRREELPWTADRVKVVGSRYTDAERPDLSVWSAFFAKAKEYGLTDVLIADDGELPPDVVPVFRGIRTAGYERGYSWALERGYSWALDRDQAEWFARRLHGDSPRVLVGTVPRDAVLAYMTERNEEEIIARPRT